jgi:hypothetical protein
MEPRTILIKPADLPALPAYDTLLRGFRAMTLFLLVYPFVLAALFLFIDLKPIGIIVAVLVLVPSDVFLIRRFGKLRAQLVAIMAGEIPVVSAVKVDGGYELRSGNASRGGLPVHVGDSVSVSVERGRDPRRSSRLMGYVTWRFAIDEATPLTVITYFDADPALLRDVERRLKGLGVSAKASHKPFADTPIA